MKYIPHCLTIPRLGVYPEMWLIYPMQSIGENWIFPWLHVSIANSFLVRHGALCPLPILSDASRCNNHLGGNIWKVLDSYVEDIWNSVLKGCIPWTPKFRAGIAAESFLQARITLMVKKRDSASQPALENLLPNVETQLLQLVLECFYV